MAAQTRAEGPLKASVANTFDVLAWEIEVAGARCIFLDAMIGDLMRSVPKEDRDRLVESMHAVDLLSQHLTSLSAFARQMGADAPPDACAPVASAISEITLGALADRMLTAFGGHEPVADGADAGDLDLF